MTWNEYKLGSTDGLRAVLKSYRALMATSDDIESATMLFDLGRALDEDGVLTPRQRKAIELHLIQDKPVAEVAHKMYVEDRVVYLIVNAGLRRLLRYLQTGQRPRPNRHQGWTDHDTKILIYYAALPRPKLAEMLHRSVSSIYQKLSELRSNGLLIVPGRPGRVVPAPDGKAGTKRGVSNTNRSAATASAQKRGTVGPKRDRSERKLAPTQAEKD